MGDVLASIREIVDRYIKEFPEEEYRLRQLQEFLKNTLEDDELRSRENFVGHLTASGFVVNRRTHKVLRIFHKSLRTFLQPGGHIDLADSTPFQAALREVREETSLDDLIHLPYHFDSEIPIDIDSHFIPKNEEKNEPGHYHHDFGYLFLVDADEDAPVIRESEANTYSWDEISQLRRQYPDNPIVPKIERVLGPDYRQRYFYEQIIQRLGVTRQANTIVVTHILPGVMEFLNAVGNVSEVLAVIPKPRSIVTEILQEVEAQFRVLRVTREELMTLQDTSPILGFLDQSDGPVVIFDVGGWFAPVINQLNAIRPRKILGVIEDTENGLQRYEELANLSVPVISVARSPLKDNEDFLVGQSILFSADTILREQGQLLQYLNCSVIGFGKIGRSIAHHLLFRGVKPNVFDINPVKRVSAYNYLCNIPTREELFGTSEVIFSATGSQSADIIDFRSLRKGCFLFSVTSSDDEFNLNHLPTEYRKEKVTPFVDRYYSSSNYFYLVNSGNAVNFIHKAVLGDFIQLVRAEMLFAYMLLSESPWDPGIHTIDDDWRDVIATHWLSAYLEFWKPSTL